MVSLAIIPPVAGLFTDALGIRSGFLLGAAIMLVSFGVMSRGYTAEPQPPNDPAKPSDAPAGRKAGGGGWSLLASPELAVVAAIVFVGQYVERVFWPLAPLLVVEMEPGSEQIGLLTGLVLGIGSGATALSALVCGRLARRAPARLLLIGSLVCGCLTLPVLALMDSFWQFMAVRVVMGLLTGGIVTLAYAHVSTFLPSDRLSASFSMFASVAMVASAVGPVSMSTLATTAGLRAPLLVGAAGFACCVVLLVGMGRTRWATVPTPRSEGVSHSS
jgi:DHA1 family multidrug resistance protein-like MFS transporter